MIRNLVIGPRICYKIVSLRQVALVPIPFQPKSLSDAV